MTTHLIAADLADYFQLSKKTWLIKGLRSTAPVEHPSQEHTRRLWVDGIEILPEQAFVLRPFYECDFDWGNNGGLSSFTSALAICLSIFKEERVAENLYECFKEYFVQQFPDGDFELEVDLSDFLRQFNSRLHPYLYSRFCYAALIDSREISMYQHPVTGSVTVNVADNYATHYAAVPDIEVRRHNERKQRLLFRLFAKEQTIITGSSLDEVMEQVEELMSRFYWKSLERMIRHLPHGKDLSPGKKRPG